MPALVAVPEHDPADPADVRDRCHGNPSHRAEMGRALRGESCSCCCRVFVVAVVVFVVVVVVVVVTCAHRDKAVRGHRTGFYFPTPQSKTKKKKSREEKKRGGCSRPTAVFSLNRNQGHALCFFVLPVERDSRIFFKVLILNTTRL